MQKAIKVILSIYLFGLAGQVLANHCKEKYDFAVESCAKLTKSCNETLICKNLRSTCSQNVKDISGCEDYAACTGENTPNLFPSVCRYNWEGHVKNGKCVNKNSITERVAGSCPGQFTTLSRYIDPEHNCTGQVKKFKDMKLHCEEAIVKYHRSCPGDIDRPFITVNQCPKGVNPLPTVTETVMGNEKSVDVGRKHSELASSAKWPADSLTRGAPASLSIGQ